MLKIVINLQEKAKGAIIMTTPIGDPPKESSEEQQETPAQKQKWSEFLESLKDRHETKLPPILTDIAKNSFEAAATKFKEVATRDYESASVLGEKLSEALELKMLREEQVIAFFEQSLKLNPHFYFQQRLLLAEICNNTESNLDKKLVSLYLSNLINLVKLDTNEAINAYRELKDDLRSRTVIAEAYQLLNEKNQEVLLSIFFSINIRYIDRNFLYAVKTANLQLFEKFIHSSSKNITEEERTHINKQINEKLKDAHNPFISAMRNGDFKTAVEAFICHPGSPIALYSNLEREKSKVLSEKEMLQFFSVLLENKSQQNMWFCFEAIRACFESNRSRNANPNLVSQMMLKFLTKAINEHTTKEACELLASKTAWNSELVKAYGQCSEKEQSLLLTGFMVSYIKNQNVTLLLEFRKANPDLFDKTLSGQDAGLQKTIQDALSAAAKEEANVVYEWTFEEEDLVSSFNDFLENPSKAGKGLLAGMEKIGNIIDGSKYHDMYPNLSKKFIELYLKKAMDVGKLNEVCELLSSRPTWVQHILDAYQSQSKEDQEKLLQQFLSSAAKKYNANLLCGLRELNPIQFDKVLLTQDEETTKTIKRLLTIPAPARLATSNLMMQFSLPFREMLPYAAKIVCAETHQRKKSYSFTPTVLKSSELKDYLTLLKSKKPPVRAKFIVPAPGFRTFAADHWIAGEVDIPETGAPRLLLIDSMGSAEPKTHDFIMTELKDMKELTIYLSSGKRQITGAGCTVFALKDVQDLFTIGDYLDPKYKKDIFEYVSQNAHSKVYNSGETGKHEQFPFSVYSSLLPLRFMRSEQSKTRSLLDATIPARSKEEQELPVNKKKETALQSSKKHFKLISIKEGTKELNTRIEYKLNKMANHVLDYLDKHQFDFAQIEKESEPFTLEGLKKQMAVPQTVTNPAVTTSKEQLDKQEKEKQLGLQEESKGLYFQSSKLEGRKEAVPQSQKADIQEAGEKADISHSKDTTLPTDTNEKDPLKRKYD